MKVQLEHLVLTLVFAIKVEAYDVSGKNVKMYEEKCRDFGKNPYFEPDMVVGKPWRIYYTWNMNLQSKCMDITFKHATKQTVKRIYNDMLEYMEEQPPWEAATLVMTMGRADHELLLIADQGAAGSFVAVPNVVRDGNITPNKNSIPLLRFQFKLIRDGQYLVQMDCKIGVAAMAARSDEPPYRADVDSVAQVLRLGEGSHSCSQDQNKNENLLIE